MNEDFLIVISYEKDDLENPRLRLTKKNHKKESRHAKVHKTIPRDGVGFSGVGSMNFDAKQMKKNAQEGDEKKIKKKCFFYPYIFESSKKNEINIKKKIVVESSKC